MQDGYKKLLKRIKKNITNYDLTLLEKAYNMSKAAHEGQLRVSGEPFIVHPVEVSLILADLDLDCVSVISGILHDTIEDTTCTLEDLKRDFGEEIAMIVDGVTKLERIPYTTKEEKQAESLRKMFLAMAKDIRVILIKLADRLHNMRTLDYMPTDKQIQKSRETLEIYAPLAHRLGMSAIKWELEDISLKYIDPKGYRDLNEKIDKRRKEREAYIKQIINTIEKKTRQLGIKVKMDGRPKHFYSIYRKMKRQNKTIEQIYDLFAVRVLVNSVKDCYAVLGLVHELYKPMPGRFKDYIAMPKPNMYQSLHSTLIGPEGLPFEIQIRTWDMHRVAELGIAAHWKYKEGKQKHDDVDKKLAWLRQLLEWQKDMRDADEFMENLKIDLFTDEVFIFTPKGDVINLPAGATTIDFAYNIHSAVGNKMIGAKVNGKMLPINLELQNGDIVEILTSTVVQGPKLDWLKIAKSSQARNKINQWFKKEKREENIVKGKDIIEKELKKQGLVYGNLFKPEWVEMILKKHTFNTLDDLFSSIGFGAITANKVITKLKEEYKKTLKSDDDDLKIIEDISKKQQKNKRKMPESGIIVKGIDNCLVRLSRCCNPVPGDDIMGYITRGRGVSVHRRDCINISDLDGEGRLIEVSWFGETNKTSYKADVAILANDRTALLMEVTNAIGESKIPLKAITARTTKDQVAVMNITLEITNTEQLEKIIKKIKKIDSIFNVTRTKY
ncbi:MAG: bifunctional (p)ppGpp synthetase/guanosine-3',5'-bis(diphosphate) 3'-pyrophosphohydrolase [Clostridiales bacterium]